MAADSLWARWRRFAHRAAQVQSYIVLSVLYVVAIVPMRLVGLGRGARHGTVGWHDREPGRSDLDAAHRQY